MAPAQPLVVTAGEPAGIGPEICLALADVHCEPGIVVIGDPSVLEERAQATQHPVRVREIELADVGCATAAPGELLVIAEPLPVRVECGCPDPGNAEALLRGLRIAVDGCMSGTFGGLVTAPLQKSTINQAGIEFSGHTEFLAELTGARRPVMLLASTELRVALATTHLPLREVPDRLSPHVLREVLDVLLAGLKDQFGIANPGVLVCGLNPHAGENGHLGSEDASVIAPVVRELSAQGHRVHGPVPADTAFTPLAGDWDAVLAMYHDQGLPVIKYAGFGHAVNVTLGLPIVRTSVDHGTALDLAGLGRADPGSLIAAVELAARLAEA